MLVGIASSADGEISRNPPFFSTGLCSFCREVDGSRSQREWNCNMKITNFRENAEKQYNHTQFSAEVGRTGLTPKRVRVPTSGNRFLVFLLPPALQLATGVPCISGRLIRYMFMPELPKHLGCINFYDLERVSAPPEPEKGTLNWLFS
jgi:hypothetical protein